MIEKVTDENLDVLLGSSDKVMVKFYADWCGVCKAFEPQFKRIAKEHSDKVKFVEINAPDNPKARLKAGVYSLPFFATYSKGELVDKIASSEASKVQGMLESL